MISAHPAPEVGDVAVGAVQLTAAPGRLPEVYVFTDAPIAIVWITRTGAVVRRQTVQYDE